MTDQSHIAVVEDELSRLGFAGRAPVEIVVTVVSRARQLVADPTFCRFKPGAYFADSTVEEERFRWAAIAAAGELRRALREQTQEPQ